VNTVLKIDSGKSKSEFKSKSKSEPKIILCEYGPSTLYVYLLWTKI